MTVRVTFNETGPITQFLLDVDYIGMSIDGNYSIVDVRIRNVNTGSGTTSWYGGAGVHTGSIDGVGEFARWQVGSNFLNKVGSGVTRWDIWKRVNIPHSPDGTRGPAVVRMHVQYGSITRDGEFWLSLPTIPRATTPRFRVDSTDVTAFDAGTAMTVFLDRASASFTHDVTFQFGTQSGTIATGAGVSAAWTPPLSLLSEIPNATAGTGTVTVVTKNGSTVIGTIGKQFTLRAPASVIPTISGINVADDNPDVASRVGAFVQGQSRLKATVVAAGIYGSTISSSMVTVDGQTVPSGQSLPLPQSGTRVVAAAVTDSRGRTASNSGNVTVLPYDLPQIVDFTVQRATSAGVPSSTGAYLLMTLNAAVTSLVNGTEKNAMTITVATRPRGGSAWTDRNVITPGLTYNTSVLVSGGGIFLTTTAWDVRVTVADKLQSAQDFYLAPTAGAILDATPTKVAIGKMVEDAGPALQLQGPARVYDGDLEADIELRHRGGYAVEPVGILVAFAGATAPSGWLLCDGSAVSRTTYATLFAVIGTAYGAGNGSSTFNVPDLRGRIPVGRDSTQTEFDALGETGGEKTHKLTPSEMPTHNHAAPSGYFYVESPNGSMRRAATINNAGSNGEDGVWRQRIAESGGSPMGTANSGGDGVHNNLQPYVVTNHIIKAF
ncbi:DUF859 family phage minor structural protein [Microbacterium sp. 22195]|uniref:DUF859 family phage minor structural protein n=1 Tax=Microbacterium sp. 22195 TaxID=3453891 RepID=UPI003F857012